MKLFYSREDMREKVNFVDENNVLVGYDMESSCCEHYGWFIAPKETREEPQATNDSYDAGIDTDLEGWFFDRAFIRELDNVDWCCDGGLAIFRMTKGDQVQFLHLFNVQSGYYSHGFEVKMDGKTVREGSL